MLRVNGHAVTQIRHNGAIITDVPQRLSSCTMNFSGGPEGEIEYTVEGDDTVYRINVLVDGESAIYTWPDGFTCTITFS